MDCVGEDLVKKSKVHYLRCQRGALHEGQLLTLVCVDSKCQIRGLVCPVCRAEEHPDHKIVPLKVFLQEASNRFTTQTNEHELTSLSDYLRQLESSRKLLLDQLAKITSTLSAKIKTIEEKIHQNYSILRKVTLTESTISKKLPRLIRMMIDPSTVQDSDHLVEQFQKYALLAKYEDDNMYFEDNIKLTIEKYSEKPTEVQEYLNTNLPTIMSLLQQIPFALDPSKPIQPVAIKYTFSKTLKHKDIVVNTDKEVSVPGLSDDDDEGQEKGGVILVKEGLGHKTQTIAFKVINMDSGSVVVGAALPEVVKSNLYRMDEINHGMYGMRPGGYTVRHNRPEEEEESEQGFDFQAGDTIQIDIDSKSKKLTFTKRGTSTKYVMNLSNNDVDLTKLQFAVDLYGRDTVQIVD